MILETPEQLFAYELSALLDAERQLLETLPTMATESGNEAAQSALQHHQAETQQQAQNLQQCFQHLGQEPQDVPCLVIQALMEEHDEFLEQEPSQVNITAFVVAACAKVEHYEIACYKNLIQTANFLNQHAIVGLLQQNLQQEEAMAQRVEHLASQLGQQTILAAR